MSSAASGNDNRALAHVEELGPGVVPFMPFEDDFHPLPTLEAVEQYGLRVYPGSSSRMKMMIELHVGNVKENDEIKGKNLTMDELIAIAWYTSDVRALGKPKEANAWFALNSSCRKRDVNLLDAPLKSLLYHVSTGLQKTRLPPKSPLQIVWRGLDVRLIRLSRHLKQGKMVMWPSLTSTSLNRDVMTDFAKGGTDGGTLVKIEACEISDAQSISMIPEGELMLGANALLEVKYAIPSEELKSFPGLEGLPDNVDVIVLKQHPTPAEFSIPLKNTPVPPVPVPIPPKRGKPKNLQYLSSQIPTSHQECFDGKVPSTFHETGTVKLLTEIHNEFHVAHTAAVCANLEALRAISSVVLRLQWLHERSSLPLAHALALGGCPPSFFQEFITDNKLLRLRTPKGFSTLHLAAHGGCTASMEYLLSTGAKIDERANDGWTVLMSAAQGGSVEAMKFLISNGAKIDEKRNDGFTVLMSAAEGGSVEAMKFLISNGAKIDEKRNSGGTVLMSAAQGGSVEAMKFLISNGAKIDEKCKDGFTVLMSAAQGGSVEAMKFLISNGAKIDEKRNDGGTALMLAAYGGSVEAMKFLISNGAKIDEKDNDGNAVLMLAAKGGSVEAMNFLISNGAKIDEKANGGWTVLMCAADEGKIDIVRYLLSCGADRSWKNNSGRRAIDLAKTAAVKDALK